MYQLTLKVKSQLENATRRAQAQKPRIEEICFGMYKVWSSNPQIVAPYSVGIEPAQDGGYTACCSCPTQNYFCKHVAAIFPHYLMREKQELQPTEAAQSAALTSTYQQAKAQAEKALADLAAAGWQPDQVEETESMDRECPACGLVQPDDDSSDCFACGAILNPDDFDPEPDPKPAPAPVVVNQVCRSTPSMVRAMPPVQGPIGSCTVCGKAEANVFFPSGERLCWPCLLDRAEGEAEKEAHQAMIEKDRQDLFG